MHRLNSASVFKTSFLFALVLVLLSQGLPAFAVKKSGARHTKKVVVKTGKPGPQKVVSAPGARLLTRFTAAPKNTLVWRGKLVIPAAKASWLRQGDLIVGGAGNTDVSLGQQGTLRLKPGTKIRLKTLQRVSKRDPNTVDNRFQVEKGTFLARLKPLRGQSRFIIDTPSATTAARGTAFVLEVSGQKSRLLVSEGLMSIASSKNARAVAALISETPAAGLVSVGAGQKIEVSVGSPLKAISLTVQEEKQTDELGQLALPNGIKPLATIQFWPSATRDIAISPDGQIAAATGNDGRVAFRDMKTGAIWQSQGRHKATTNTLAFAPTGNLIASGDTENDGEVWLWDRLNGDSRALLRGHNEYIRDLVFSQDASTLFVGGNTRITLFDVQTRQLKDTWKMDRIVSSLAMSPDGKVLAVGEEKGYLEFWDWQNHRLLSSQQVLKDQLLRLKFSSQNLLAACDYSSVALFDPQTFGLVRRIPETRDHQSALAFSPDGKTLYTGGHYAKIASYDVATGAPKGEWDPKKRIQSMAVSPDGKQLITGDVGMGSCDIWNVATGAKQLSLPELTPFTAPHPFLTLDKKYFLQRDRNQLLRMWDLSTGEVVACLSVPLEETGRAVYLPKQGVIVDACWNGLRFWKQQNGSWRVMSVDRRSADEVAIAPDGAWVATTREAQNTMRIYEPATGKLLREFEAFTPRDYSFEMMATSPDGQHLAALDEVAGTVRVYETQNWRVERQLEGLKERGRCVAFSPDGTTIAAATRNQICLWDTATGELKRQLTRDESDDYFYLDFSPDGKKLAASVRYQIRIWNLETGESEREIIAEDCSEQQFVKYIAGGKHLVTGGGEESPGQLMIWDAQTGERLATLYGFGRTIIGPVGTQDAQQAAPSPNSWLAVTSEGYFDGSPDALNWVRWRVGSELLPGQVFARAMHRPDKVREALGF